MPAEKSAQEIAVEELRKHGAFFKTAGLFELFLEYPETEELKRIRKESFYLSFNEKDWKNVKQWTGGREKLKYLRDLPTLREVSLYGPNFTDEWCEELDHLPQLEGLFFSGKSLTDRGLAHVSKLTNLKALSLLDTSISDNGMRYLKELKHLRWLSLSGTNVTDAGLVHLRELTNLEDLSLEGTETTREGLTHLKGLTKLRRVRLASSLLLPEKPAGLGPLAGMTDLRKLDARGLAVTDDELKVVRNMTALSEET